MTQTDVENPTVRSQLNISINRKSKEAVIQTCTNTHKAFPFSLPFSAINGLSLGYSVHVEKQEMIAQTSEQSSFSLKPIVPLTIMIILFIE